VSAETQGKEGKRLHSLHGLRLDTNVSMGCGFHLTRFICYALLRCSFLIVQVREVGTERKGEEVDSPAER
jgi:hypothetical protein